MKSMHIHKMIYEFITLMFASLGVVIGQIAQNHTHDLHYAFMAAQGLCYLISAGVGSITIYKFFRKKDK